MSRRRMDLIESVVDELAPVQRSGRTGLLLLVWLLGSWAFVVAATLWTAPLRPGVVAQLRGSPHFAGETLLGIVAGIALVTSALALGIPRPGRFVSRITPALGIAALWVATTVVGLWVPALDPSMLGKRGACTVEVLVYGVPPLLVGLWMLRGLAPLRRMWAGALLGAAAGALPALLMQLACMYLVDHVLIHHIAPIAVVAALGALLGPLVLRRI